MTTPPAKDPQRLIRSSAPIRICDMGGWTDTWFAGHGAICSIAVAPRAEVSLAVYPRAAREHQMVLHAENYGERIVVEPGAPPTGAHRLLAAAVAELPPPHDLALEATISSEAPGGCSTGTSAAVCVALLGALDRLRPGRRAAHEIAYAAHRVETQHLGQQSGIQDQLAAAYGGICFIEMFAYPHATVSPLAPDAATLWELEQRLLLIFMGHAHDSSAVHEAVIRELEADGDRRGCLEALRVTARQARDALYAGDLGAFGRAMTACTEGQAALHAGLVSADARQVIELARAHGAAGWKVNGAGGEGGSLTLLCGPEAGARRRLAEAIAANPRLRPIPIALSPDGLRVWEPGG
jgi:D-glycero-alpha-D-manno-heptose-7-phosphate kinase